VFEEGARVAARQPVVFSSFVTVTTKAILARPTVPTTRQQPTVGKVSPLGWKPVRA
jgi:hypothetical protein